MKAQRGKNLHASRAEDQQFSLSKEKTFRILSVFEGLNNSWLLMFP